MGTLQICPRHALDCLNPREKEKKKKEEGGEKKKKKAEAQLTHDTSSRPSNLHDSARGEKKKREKGFE